MVYADIGLADLLWSLLVLLFMVVYLVMLFSVVVDLFRDRELSGMAKALWALFLLVFPVLSVFVYMFARGDGMARRAGAQMAAMDAELQGAVRDAASASPSDEIARAKSLLDQGVISADEFEALKRKALA
jgi:hypothetical protein